MRFSSLTSFYSRLAVYGGEKVLLAANLALNTMLIAQHVAPNAAAAYFVVSATMQMLMSPWAPATELAWAGSRGQNSALSSLPFALIMTIAGGLFAAFVVFSQIDMSAISVSTFIIALVCNVLFLSILLIAPKKLEEPRLYAKLIAVPICLSLILKAGTLVGGRYLDDFWLILVIHVEWVLLSATALAVYFSQSGLRLKSIGLLTKPDPGSRSRILLAAMVVFATLLAGRLVPVAAGDFASPAELKSIGLTMQLLNAFSLLSHALTTSTLSQLRIGQPFTFYSRVKLAGLGVGTAALAVVGVAIALHVVPNVLMEAIFANEAGVVRELAGHGIPFALAICIQAISAAFAVVLGKQRLFVALSCLGAIAASIVLVQTEAGIATKLLSWATCLIVFSGAGLLVIIAPGSPSRPKSELVDG